MTDSSPSRGPDVGSASIPTISQSDEHLASASLRRGILLDPGVRRRWYLWAVLAAVIGAVGTVLIRDASGRGFTFVGAFAMFAVLRGGYGPMLVAGWGTLILALLVPPVGHALVLEPSDWLRVAANFVLYGLGATLGGFLWRGELRTLQREIRLADALSQMRALHAESEAAYERQRTERDLLNGILATSVAGILVVDMTGTIIFANHRAEQVLGLSASEIKNRRYDTPAWRHTDVDGGPWPEARQPFVQVVTTGEPVFEVRHGIEWPDGKRVLLSINGAPLRDAQGALEAVVFAITDITESETASKTLRERDRQLEQVTTAMPGIVFQYVLEADGRERFPFVSPFAAVGLGVDSAQIMEDARAAYSVLHPEDRLAFLASVQHSARTLSPWAYEFRTADPSTPGQWRWMSSNATPQRDDATGAITWNGIMMDVTDRRRLEDDLRQAQRIESVGRLAGGIAHDFNNVLTAILGQADLLAQDAAPGSDVADGVAHIRQAAESGAALTRQILGFARRQVMSPRVVDVASMLIRVTPLLQRVLREQVQLRLQVPADVGRVRVDPALFDQVLMNLVVNARDAIEGSGTVTMQVRRIEADDAARARYASLSDGPVIEISVIDTGTGMTDEVRARALEPFFTTKAVGQGTGLGLATSYGIVMQAGGSMELDSVEGEGTTVRIALPAVSDRLEEAPSPASPARGGRETILVVDDDAAVRRVTMATLTRRGYDVVDAPDGNSAILLARALPRRIDLLLSDVVMPGMTGIELAKALRAEGLVDRVLFVSGYARGMFNEAGQLPDDMELLSKPFDVAEIEQRVRQALDQSGTASITRNVDT